MNLIHPSAIVHPEAELGENVQIGPYTVVEKDTVIGADCELGSHVLIARGARLGAGCRVFNGAVVGTIPQDLKYQGEDSLLNIGERTTIREFATLNRGTVESGSTDVGAGCLIMAYAHIAHDCKIGDNVIIANAVNLAGHVVVDDFASIGGMTPVHQFVRIGRHVFIGGGFRVPKDVPPYILAGGEPMKYTGLNIVGLQRREFKPETIATIKRAYRFLFRSGLNVSQALVKIESELEPTREVKMITDFIRNSKRGLIR